MSVLGRFLSQDFNAEVQICLQFPSGLSNTKYSVSRRRWNEKHTKREAGVQDIDARKNQLRGRPPRDLSSNEASDSRNTLGLAAEPDHVFPFSQLHLGRARDFVFAIAHIVRCVSLDVCKRSTFRDPEKCPRRTASSPKSPRRTASSLERMPKKTSSIFVSGEEQACAPYVPRERPARNASLIGQHPPFLISFSILIGYSSRCCAREPRKLQPQLQSSELKPRKCEIPSD